MNPGIAAESGGQLQRVTVHHQVQVEGAPAAQQVADRAADHIDAVELGDELDQLLTGGERPNLREQLFGGRNLHGASVPNRAWRHSDPGSERDWPPGLRRAY